MDQSPSSSSSMRRRNYDVFLSFRGPDARHTIISHLYRNLSLKGVYTFKDSEGLEAGRRRSDLFRAIEGSRLAIVTFSENYARSRWCLDELRKIMELKQQGKLAVLPIFYRVSPGDVRLQDSKGCFQKAMKEVEAKYGKDSEMVRRWREALWQGGDLIGFLSVQGRDEGDVVREVVEMVLKLLNRVSLEVAKYPVGIDHRLREIRPLLHLDPHSDDVYMVGLLGQVGAGKTTLSKAICNHIADRFDSWCFLPNVRETTLRVFNGLAHLQQTLLRQLLSEEKLIVSSVDAGKQLIKERLRNQRVLVILDDVDETDQFEALAGSLSWFGIGSRIVITTRNNHVLTSDRVQHVYDVKLLRREEARNLFRFHALGEMQERISIDPRLIDSFIEYAGDLPLALVVLGAFLRGRSASDWEGKLKELAKAPERTINSVLKISFDGLEDKHKEIFLDVACFFNGWKVDDVEKILDSCGIVTSLGLAILVERCLVTVDHGNVQMHALMEAMGQNIVRGEYLKGNGVPSRIWLHEDFLDILSEDRMQERQAVKGIVLNVAEEKVILIKPNALLGFKNLRFLIARNVASPRKKLQLPRELRWLEWRRCAASAIEFDQSSKLVGLDLVDSSKIRWIKGMGFEELKYVNLSGCCSLHMLPDLSKCMKLEDLNLSACNSLTSLDEAVRGLENLLHLDIGYRHKRETFPSLLRSKHLRTLDFSGCSKLYKLPAIKESLKFLETLDLSGTAVKELPDSFDNLVAVKKLSLSSCKELATVPSSIYKLQALERLEIFNCQKLSRFPRSALGAATDILGFPNLVKLVISRCKLKDLEFLNDLTCLETLSYLDLSENSFARVPACVSKFMNLEEFHLRNCRHLEEVMELPCVSKLFVNACRVLKSFPSFHSFVYQIPKWFWVDLSNCPGLANSYIDRSLPLEKVRGFVGAANIIYPGAEFPHWVNFQTTECDPRYRVTLPWNMSKDDISGLVLFVSFDYVQHLPEKSERCSINTTVNHIRFSMDLNYGGGGIHTWFFNVFPLSAFFWRHHEVDAKLNGSSSFTLEFRGKGAKLRRWGMCLLCKREEDDCRIKVCKAGEDEKGSSLSEHVLRICL